jgi:ABC-type antimicrobial peptide transport system permease subunit
MEEHAQQIGVALRLFTWLFVIFGCIALLISIIGIYAVTAYAVGQRTKELGVRIALGAAGSSILWLVLRQGLGRLVAGLIVGFAGAAATTRLISGMMFQVEPTDLPTFIAVGIVFTAVCMAACVIPALRSVRIDPATVLRLD